jgi:hypothetical protein
MLKDSRIMKINKKREAMLLQHKLAVLEKRRKIAV